MSGPRIGSAKRVRKSAGLLGEDGGLTAEAFRGDRSMRESGFDPGFRFGPFNLDCLQHVPICLNSLLWRLEKDIASIRKITGAVATLGVWVERAEQRRAFIDRFLWDLESVLYRDFHTGRSERTTFIFATTFWPLWAGFATPEQARAVAANLPHFETAGGIRTGPARTGCQWDAPFGWAPLTLMAAQGLRRYGYVEDARRIALAFLGMVHDEFRRTGRLFEKYDTESLTSEVAGLLDFGYPTNEPGFGWTNAAVLEFLHMLEMDGQLNTAGARYPAAAKIRGSKSSSRPPAFCS